MSKEKKTKVKKPKHPVKTWAVATSIILVFVLMVNVVCSCTFLYDLICLVLGQKQAVYAEGSTDTVYEATTESKADAVTAANALVEEIAGEGIILLKNADGALPLSSGLKVSVFGKNSVNLVYSGSGSGSGDNSSARTIFESLEEAGFTTNATLKAFYEDNSMSGSPRGKNGNFSQDMAKFDTAETPWSSYTADVKASFTDYSDAAIVVLSRIGGEEFDLTNSALAQNERHYLELTENEEEMLRQVCAAGFGKVIVVINSANVMELGFIEDNSLGRIDACLWMGAPGNSGVMALGRILNGSVNPSGHTVDTWIADVTKDPTYNNFGDNGMDNGDRYTVDGKNKNYYFVDYEEGIYVGYRYYETADYEARQGNYDGFVYEEQVVYPFGYGLSYTGFAWTMKDDSSLNGVSIAKDGSYAVTVTVKNTGDMAGKDVIQLYASAPYTAGGIEKPYKVLVGFVKTDVLQPGETKDYTIKVDPYDFASYDYSDANGNGFRGYELDSGDYTLFIAHNAHESEFSVPFKVAADGILYETDPDTDYTVENRFETADDQLGSLLSRADFAGTWPQTRTDEERAVTKAFISSLGNRESGNTNEYIELPATGVTGDAVISFKEMVGLNYDDARWDAFIDQLTTDEMANLINQGAFKTESIERLGVPKTTDSDGPVGFVAFQGSGTVYGTANYCCEVMMASTWNVDLLAKYGASLAEEGLHGNEAGDGMPYSGIYAPAANIHRSIFSGRNWEYFSEDGFLSGMMAAAEVKAASENGLVMFMKHFVANDQETHRNAHGLCTWMNEQSLRELYMKPFEKAVKDGGTVGIMSSFNRIGTTWTGGSYALLTEVLRNEWGFTGTVITDYSTDAYCDPYQMIYAGGDLNLTSTIFLDSYDTSSAADVSMLRRAAKDILYTVSRSNAMQGEIIGYTAPTWQIVMFIVSGCIAALTLLGLALALRKKKLLTKA